MDIIKVILTSFLSAVALFVIAKIIGHKQMSQLDFFDYITGITVGSIAAELATELEEPLKPFMAMVVYGVVSFFLSILTSKHQRLRKFINGTPSIIMEGGKIYRRNMKKAKLDLSEFMVMCRQQGYFNLDDIETAVFEYNGNLTILPKSDKRPANPSDLKIEAKQEYISTEVIMDGRVLMENLKRLNLDLKWLNSQIKVQGFSDAKEVFLGIYDNENQLTLYKGE